MQLKPNVGSDRSWVYTAPHDLSEGTPSTELLAVRFANAENANQFKDKFNKAQKINSSEEPLVSKEEPIESTDSTEPVKPKESEEPKEPVKPEASEEAKEPVERQETKDE